jgi:HEAT repeat protein
MKPLYPLVALLGLALSAQAVAPPSQDAERVAVLLKQLDADDFNTRESADRALRACSKWTLPLLRQEHEHTDSLEVRKRLAGIIHALTAEERVAALIRLLGDSRSDCREQADQELRCFGTEALPLLRKELKPSLDEERRKRLERIITELAPGR